MYELAEGKGDYQIEGDPVDFEVTSENVLVLQERDMEQSSLEEVAMALEAALNDFAAMAHHRVKVAEAIDSKSAFQGALALKHSVDFRASLAKRYGGPRVAVENYSYNVGVLVALEAEAEEQKGFFTRIIDAIAKAFRWLWTKITELFSKKKDEAKTEKAKKDIEKVKEAEKSGGKPVEEFITKDNTLKHFGFLGEHVTEAMVQDHIQKQHEHLKKMVAIIADASDFFEQLVNVSSNDESPDGYMREMTRIGEAIMARSINTLPSSSKDELTKAGALVENQAIDEGSAKKLEGFLEGGGYYAWIERRSNVKMYASKFVVPKEIKVAKKIDFPKAAKLEDMLKSSEELDKAIAESTKKILDTTKRSDELVDTLKRNLEKRSAAMSGNEGGKKEQQVIFGIVQAAGSAIHRNISAAARGVKQVERTSLAFFEYSAATAAREFEKPATEEKKD